MHISLDKLAAARVLVVGDAMLDRYWYGAVDRISPEAPVPVVRVTRTEERVGGAAKKTIKQAGRHGHGPRIPLFAARRKPFSGATSSLCHRGCAKGALAAKWRANMRLPPDSSADRRGDVDV